MQKNGRRQHAKSRNAVIPAMRFLHFPLLTRSGIDRFPRGIVPFSRRALAQRARAPGRTLLGTCRKLPRHRTHARVTQAQVQVHVQAQVHVQVQVQLYGANFYLPCFQSSARDLRVQAVLLYHTGFCNEMAQANPTISKVSKLVVLCERLNNGAMLARRIRRRLKWKE